jgi:hypothetical protein
MVERDEDLLMRKRLSNAQRHASRPKLLYMVKFCLMSIVELRGGLEVIFDGQRTKKFDISSMSLKGIPL